MTQPDNTAKQKTPPPRKLMLVRFGKMGTLGWCEHNETNIPRTRPHVVIKTSRGLELGQLVGVGNYRSGQFKSTPEQVEEYFGPTETGQPVITETGTFVRFATPEDLREQQHLEISAVQEAKTCEKLAAELNLPMKIIEAEHLFGGERVVIYFTSEGRVDFRELVKRMAREYQTRIELRQIGSRDEAKLVGDYETCGQECCCKRFLKILAPVNMRMAKLQKATLDPSKISGHCGRLKCCLRYEDATYLELRERLPKKGETITTAQGVGRVVDVQILTQLVVVQFENGDRQAWPVDEINALNKLAPAEEVQKEVASQPQPEISEKEITAVDEVTTEIEDLSRQMRSEEQRPRGGQQRPPRDSQPQSRPQQQGQQDRGGKSDRPGGGKNRNKKFKKRFQNNNGNNNPGNRNNGGPRPNQNQNQRPNRPPQPEGGNS
ncbi:MAG TPA: regulatory iron-sulfur-containing complex subunit RicT [Anaerohalosphaeraceae bacterium]|nr:regulatory iron-sulfur-containing complex subunit RicT [Anaerohalosphaeraceae bacterium]